MIWSRERPYLIPNGFNEIEPTRVFYEFDGPLVFTAPLGLQDLLFSKVDEANDLDLYIAVAASERVLDALAEGTLSLLGALGRDQCYVIEASSDNKIRRYWNCFVDELPKSLLPQAGTGIDINSPFVVDTVEQLDAFFSVRFTGERLTHQYISFSTFKRLVNTFYDASRRILAPDLLAKSKSATFDFPLFAPAFGSLVLSIGSPNLSQRNIRRLMGGNTQADLDGVREQFAENRSVFFEELQRVVRQAEAGDLSEQFADEHFEVLDDISELLPTESTMISGAEFNAVVDGKLVTTQIDVTTGERMKRGHKLAESRPRLVSGTIFLINSEGNKFTIRGRAGRKVTCQLSGALFEELSQSRLFRDGAAVRVKGEFQKRVQRDLMHLEELPEFLED